MGRGSWFFWLVGFNGYGGCGGWVLEYFFTHSIVKD